MKHAHLNIGQIYVADEPTVISTVLGSCVSVCIYCPQKHVGGMIHFALPSPDFASHKHVDRSHSGDKLRFGSLAIHTLAQEVARLAGHWRLHAKIIGGASVVDELQQAQKIGRLNIETAESLLSEMKIAVVGRDVGGRFGRKVLFYTGTGRVRTAAIKPSQSTPSSSIQSTASSRVQVAPRKRRVLVVDDSRTMQVVLRKILSQDPRLEVVGMASDPIEAEPMLTQLKPDVMTLDIHMPRMDGVTFLEKIIPRIPIPTVMITSVSLEESDHIFRALELGAVDYIQKPSLSDPLLAPLVCEKVFGASEVSVKQPKTNNPKTTVRIARRRDTNLSTLIAIGSSTGGTEALKEVLIRLPEEIPPIVIVQHFPPIFSKAFADRLNDICPFQVKEASDGDVVEKNKVLIAPGGLQMTIEPYADGLRTRIIDGPPVNRHKPSVDVLFDSVSKHIGKKAIGVILTGMGSDGAKGLLGMKTAGAHTIAQDEASCVVFGMPKAAIEIGAADEVHPLHKIPEVLDRLLSMRIAS